MALTKAQLAEYQKLRAIWRKDPKKYARQRLGLKPTWQQAKIIESVAPDGAKITCRSGHGIGKSSALTAIILWHLECFDYSKTVCTAPTRAQLEQVLWAELSKWIRKSDEVAAKQGLPKEVWLSNLFKYSATAIRDNGDASQEWFCVARTSRKENPDALQGFHASDLEISEDGRSVKVHGVAGSLLFVIEEASGVPDVIVEVAEGALSSHDTRLVLVGNATKNTGFFARSHKKDRASFTAVLKFRSDESPLVDPNYRPNLVKKYGEGSNVVRVRADGEFPKQDDDVLIPIEHTEAALARTGVEPIGKKILGVDVARMGTNRTVFTLRQGRRVSYVEVHPRQDTQVTAGKARNAAVNMQVEAIHVDVCGVGGGVVDRLNEERAAGNLQWIDTSGPVPRIVKIEVIAVDSGESAPERKVVRTDDDGKKATPSSTDAQGRRMRDYLWLKMAEWFRDEEPSFEGVEKVRAEELAAECCVVTYRIDGSGILIVASKEEISGALNEQDSPDIADSLMLTFYIPKKTKATRKELGF